MKQLIYQIIYDGRVNYLLRNIGRFLKPVLPDKLRLPPSGIIKIKDDQGNTLKIKTNQTGYLTYFIFWEGYKNFEYTDIFLRLINKIHTFYDIGANIGYYTLLASMANKNIQVVAFEPAAGPLHYLKENIRINNFRHILVEPIALSDKKGSIDFYEVQNKKYSVLNLSGESNIGGKNSKKDFDIKTLPTNTLDDYVKNTEEKMIDLIKIDTEGTEDAILKGSSQILETMKPIVICETLFNLIEPQIETIMNNYGYEFFNHTKTGLKKVNSIIRKEDDGVRNCFFVHPCKYHLIDEFVSSI